MAANTTYSYDESEVTPRESQAAAHQTELSKWNVDATANQLQQQLSNYDMANQQNRQLANVQIQQNRRKSESDRLNAMRDLQNAALGVMGSMNQAMNGSTIGNLLRMLESRNDRDNETYWAQLQVNNDAVNNAYQEALNQNQVAKNDAAINAEQTIRGMESDLSANLNNINPSLYQSPGTGDADFGGKGTFDRNRVNANLAQLSGYVMPDNYQQVARQRTPRNQLNGGSGYYNRLINGFNGRR